MKNLHCRACDTSGESAELVLGKGEFDCSTGTVKLAGGSGANAYAKLIIPNDVNVDPNFKHIELESGGWLDVNDNLDIDENSKNGYLTITESSNSYELDVGDDKTFTVDRLVIDAADGAISYTPELHSTGKVWTAD